MPPRVVTLPIYSPLVHWTDEDAVRLTLVPINPTSVLLLPVIRLPCVVLSPDIWPDCVVLSDCNPLIKLPCVVLSDCSVVILLPNVVLSEICLPVTFMPSTVRVPPTSKALAGLSLFIPTHPKLLFTYRTFDMFVEMLFSVLTLSISSNPEILPPVRLSFWPSEA